MKRKDFNHRSNSMSGLIVLLRLIWFVLFCALLFFFYLLFQNPIHRFINQPEYSTEYLQKYTEKRKLAFVENVNQFEKGIHVASGMVYDKNFKLVHQVCTACHSAKLVTQNRATREGWKQMIVWMQKTQGLSDLGDAEPKILDYLSTHYAPKEFGRRKALDVAEIEWYILELDKETEIEM